MSALDLNQRWLATGKEPKRHSFQWEELDAVESPKRLSFLDALNNWSRRLCGGIESTRRSESFKIMSLLVPART